MMGAELFSTSYSYDALTLPPDPTAPEGLGSGMRSAAGVGVLPGPPLQKLGEPGPLPPVPPLPPEPPLGGGVESGGVPLDGPALRGDEGELARSGTAARTTRESATSTTSEGLIRRSGTGRVEGALLTGSGWRPGGPAARPALDLDGDGVRVRDDGGRSDLGPADIDSRTRPRRGHLSSLMSR
jgi:hypothetical protein